MVGLVAVGIALVVAHVVASRAISLRLESVVRGLTDGGPGVDAAWVAEVEGHLARLDDLVDRLPAKWTEMEEKVRASEDRTRSRIRRAVQSLEDGDQTGWDRLAREAERAGLGDGGGGEESAVPAVPGNVGAGEPPPAQDEDAWMTFATQAKWSR